MQKPAKKTVPKKPLAAASTTPARSPAKPRVTAAKPRVTVAKPRVTAAKPRATVAKPRVTAVKPRVAAGRGTKSTLARGFELNHDVIAVRAYDLFERSGHPHGRDVEFWLEAERQVKHHSKT